MSNRCSSCNKMCSLVTNEEPEVEMEIADLTVTARIRLVRESECCGEEVKEAAFEPSLDLDAEHFVGHFDEKEGVLDGHDLEIESTGVEVTERVEGKGRGAKSFYGASASFEVRCSCQEPDDKLLYEGVISDECQASSMEDVS